MATMPRKMKKLLKAKIRTTAEVGTTGNSIFIYGESSSYLHELQITSHSGNRISLRSKGSIVTYDDPNRELFEFLLNGVGLRMVK
jgi:hypothetical protein